MLQYEPDLLNLTNPETNDYYVWIDKNQWAIQIRNNNNFGIWLKSYYCKQRDDTRDGTKDNWNEILGEAVTGLSTYNEFFSADLRNRPEFTKLVKVLKTKMMFLEPGQTTLVKLRSNLVKKILRTDKLLDSYITRKNSRAIIFQATGVPLRDTTNNTTGTSKVQLDMVLNWQAKARVIKETANTVTFAGVNKTFAAPVGQQWQEGTEAAEN